jgi:hypothetical protein
MYISFPHDSGTVLGVPKNVGDDAFDMVGATMEALCGEAHRTYIDAFLETALKMKYSRDALSGQVIDIIFDDPMVTFADMYGSNMNSIFSTGMLAPVKSGKNNFSAVVAKLLSPAQKTMDKYIETNVTADQ